MDQLHLDWHDASRRRTVPVKLYLPQAGGRWPVVLHSHGLGGSRAGYAYLGRHWASRGYLAVHLQHPGSDSAIWQGKEHVFDWLRQAGADPQAAIDRVADVHFAIDQLERLDREDAALGGRLDLEQVGMSGHSFGAYTTLAIAGQAYLGPRGEEISRPDPRVKAAVLMSPPAPRHQDRLDEQFGPIAIPCLHLTGTRDTSPIRSIDAAERRLPFRHMHRAEQYLVVFDGGDHMVFAGRNRRASARRDAAIQELVLRVSTIFWDAYLRRDPAALAWLAGTGLEEALGQQGSVERKPRTGD